MPDDPFCRPDCPQASNTGPLHQRRALPDQCRPWAGAVTITPVPAPDVRTELVGRAQAVLAANRRGDWTCPSASLYPHQWLWDSCFVAIGLARYDPARAAGELRRCSGGSGRTGCCRT